MARSAGRELRVLRAFVVKTSSSLRPSSPRRVIARQEALGQADEEANAGRDGGIVEIVFCVVQVAAAGALAVAEPQHGAGTGVEEIGEILAAKRRADVAVDRRLAADL